MQSENKICLIGTVVKAPEFSHMSYGKIFYRFQLEVSRLSGQKDTLNVIFIANNQSQNICIGQRLLVDGSIRTHNQKTDCKTKLIITVYASFIKNTDEPDCNKANIKGRICKLPIFRLTPIGREITDLLIAVQRKTGKTDFIPTITWGLNARKAEHAPIGSEVALLGRLQSREYDKEINNKLEKKVAFELSASSIDFDNL